MKKIVSVIFLFLLVFFSYACDRNPADSIAEYYERKTVCIRASSSNPIYYEYAKGNSRPIIYYIRCMYRNFMGSRIYNALSREEKEKIENGLYNIVLDKIHKSECYQDDIKGSYASLSKESQENLDNCYIVWEECDSLMDSFFIEKVIETEIGKYQN